MEAILKFNLPDEQEEFDTYLNGGKYFRVIWDLDQELRAKLKYEELPQEKEEIYQLIRDRLWSILEDNGVSNDF